MVECEYITNFAIGGIYLVLIDTWWNVNILPDFVSSKVSVSFNRYMVECEYFFVTFIVAEKTVLIDTWWNVNDYFGDTPTLQSPF